MQTPCATPKRGIPWELKHDYAFRAYVTALKGFLYAIREESGAVAALKTYERVAKRDDRVKNMAKGILKAFKLEGNDAETIGDWYDIWWELTETEGIVLERSPTINRVKVTKCPFNYGYKDLSEVGLIFCNQVDNTINPKAILERPKAMCEGDPYCEYIWRIEK